MSNGLVRPHITTGCAFATAGIMVCGFVAPSIEASGVRPEVRLVQLAALTGPVASPLGVLVGTLPAAVAAGIAAAPVAQLPTAGPAHFPVSAQLVLDSQSADAPADAAVASASDATIGAWLVSLALQPVLWFAQSLPDTLKPFGFVLLLGASVFGALVAASIDAVLNPILALFGIGTSPVAALEAPDFIAPGAETFSSDPVQGTAVQVHGEAAKVADPESGSRNTAAPVGAESVSASTEPEAALPKQVPDEATEPTESVDTVGVETAAVVAHEAAPTEPEALIEGEVAAAAVDSTDDMSKGVEPEPELADSESDAAEVESATAKEDPTIDDRDSVTRTDAPSANTATAESSSPAPDSDASESAGS